MTEKRFINKGEDIFQYGEWWCSAKGEHCADVIATAMNELLKENEQLKKKLDFFNELNKPYGDLIKENQRLKCVNKQLEERLGRSLALDMGECE